MLCHIKSISRHSHTVYSICTKLLCEETVKKPSRQSSSCRSPKWKLKFNEKVPPVLTHVLPIKDKRTGHHSEPGSWEHGYFALSPVCAQGIWCWLLLKRSWTWQRWTEATEQISKWRFTMRPMRLQSTACKVHAHLLGLARLPSELVGLYQQYNERKLDWTVVL